MRLELIDIDKFAEDLPAVTSAKILEGGKISKNGIFSQQIFGPLRSYKCACPRSSYRGPHSTEETCKICNVDIASTEERRKRYAKIQLPFKVLNPLFYNLVVTAKPSSRKILDAILFFRVKFYIDPIDDHIKKLETIEDLPEDTKILEGLNGAVEYIKLLIKHNKKREFKYIESHIDQLCIKNVLVIPPDFRNFSKTSTGTFMTDTLNQYYNELLMRTSHIKKLPYELKEDHEVYKVYFKSIQKYVFDIHAYIFEKLSKKRGLIRGNILGKRVDFSGRAVISPDPTLKLNQCRAPYVIVLEILKPQLTAYLVNRKICKRYNQASSLIEECYKKRDPRLFPVVKEFCKNKLCILNRQPTLHRMSILAFEMDVHLGNTIQIHPMVCAPYNADMDGDQMSIYIPVTDLSIEDAQTKIGIWNNLVSPTDGTIVPRGNQDILLGISQITE